MSTLRITNIEAKADPSSPTVDEKIKLTNSNGDILVHIDGKTSGITTIGINTTAGNIKFDQNSNVVVTGIITATAFHGDGSALTGIDATQIQTGNTSVQTVDTGSDGHVKITTEGTERLRISSDGNIGLGTGGNTSPTAPLSIKVGSGGEYVQDFRGSATKQWGFYFLQNNWNAATFRIDEFASNGTATPRFTIYNGGKVGINQSTPQTTFHSTGTTNGQQATFGIDDSGLKISTFQKTDNDAGVILDAQKSSNGTLTLATAGTERFRITSTGKIGFNAANPPRDYCFHSGQADTNIQITNNTTGIDDSAGSLIQQDGNDLYIWNKENSFMSLGTNATERVRITSSGQFKVGGSSFVVESDGDISTNVRCHGHIELDSTGSFSSPKIKLYANTGNIELDGNLIMASGNGIDFSADPNASGMSSEVLDDYEEGTWTPVMNKSGVTGYISSPSTAVGYYRKVGKLLWISFYWYKGSGSFGNNAHPWYVSGLPFLLAHSTGSAYQFIPGGYNNINGTNYQNQSNRWQSNNVNGSATLTMYGPNSATNWTSGYLELAASGCLMVP
jgi:hypothetical protein